MAPIVKSIVKILIVHNIFHDGLNLEGDYELEFEDCPVTQIIIQDQVFYKRAKLTETRLKHILRGKEGIVKLEVCNCCGKLFVEGEINHDLFDVIEDVMDS